MRFRVSQHCHYPCLNTAVEGNTKAPGTTPVWPRSFVVRPNSITHHHLPHAVVLQQTVHLKYEWNAARNSNLVPERQISSIARSTVDDQRLDRNYRRPHDHLTTYTTLMDKTALTFTFAVQRVFMERPRSHQSMWDRAWPQPGKLANPDRIRLCSVCERELIVCGSSGSLLGTHSAPNPWPMCSSSTKASATRCVCRLQCGPDHSRELSGE